MISKTIHQIVVISTLLFLCLFRRGNHVVLSFSISSPQHGLLLLTSTTRLESGMITSSSLHRRGTSLSYHINTENDDDDHYNRNLNTNEIDDDEIDDDEKKKLLSRFSITRQQEQHRSILTAGRYHQHRKNNIQFLTIQ
jgi:hypothetical protein